MFSYPHDRVPREDLHDRRPRHAREARRSRHCRPQDAAASQRRLRLSRRDLRARRHALRGQGPAPRDPRRDDRRVRARRGLPEPRDVQGPDPAHAQGHGVGRDGQGLGARVRALRRLNVCGPCIGGCSLDSPLARALRRRLHDGEEWRCDLHGRLWCMSGEAPAMLVARKAPIRSDRPRPSSWSFGAIAFIALPVHPSRPDESSRSLAPRGRLDIRSGSRDPREVNAQATSAASPPCRFARLSVDVRVDRRGRPHLHRRAAGSSRGLRCCALAPPGSCRCADSARRRTGRRSTCRGRRRRPSARSVHLPARAPSVALRWRGGGRRSRPWLGRSRTRRPLSRWRGGSRGVVGACWSPFTRSRPGEHSTRDLGWRPRSPSRQERCRPP